METGMLHLHSLLRWIILLLLLVCLFQAISKSTAVRKTSLWLLISAHLMLIVGVYQWIAGRYGINKGLPEGIELMKDKFYRFFWIEHPLLMILAIILITVARGKAKNLNYKSVTWLLIIALLAILAAVPWPFREIVGEGRTWFPGM
ncbi:MAG TPA: hypothetical protein VFH07_11755 [Chitinophagaceae bacterium]|jgi:uncharacterized membrane protein|nr:hypothetical protein [Chitinophagaceae bacterium]